MVISIPSAICEYDILPFVIGGFHSSILEFFFFFLPKMFCIAHKHTKQIHETKIVICKLVQTPQVLGPQILRYVEYYTKSGVKYMR